MAVRAYQMERSRRPPQLARYPPAPMFRGISLANKCLLLFGGAIILIVGAALSIPAMRLWRLVDESQVQVSRDMVDIWLALDDEFQREAQAGLSDRGPFPALELPSLHSPSLEIALHGNIDAQRYSRAVIIRLSDADSFLPQALEAFDAAPTLQEFDRRRWQGISRVYEYARAQRPTASPGDQASAPTHIVVLRRTSLLVFRSLWISAIFFLLAGAAVLALAVLVFYLITHKIILQPVRSLKDTAERVREGNVAVRSDIQTGDEFEELAQTFNMMLTDLQSNQDRLRSLNQAMDVKLHEMAQSNTLLHEATRLKGEFLANVSHELRTPLHSIIGFAELLLEQVKLEAAGPDGNTAPIQRRIRYLTNIDAAGRNLLEHINSLLEMARLEAGKIDLKPERLSVRDACEGLLGLIHPLAERSGIDLKLEVQDDVPAVTTDVKKFQQIIFNFLSNAVKFSVPEGRAGRRPEIILRAEKLSPSRPDEEIKVRVSVIDNGPGIPEEEQARIFEKFYQVDASHTRQTTGTGLGLAISRELAAILRCEIQLVSGVNRGSMFSLIMPLALELSTAPISALEARFRGALAGGRSLE